MTTPMLLTLAVGLLVAGRALQVQKDWVAWGLGGFSYRYLVGSAAGYIALMVLSIRLQAPVAMLLCGLVAAFYGWMIGSRLSSLGRTKLARIVQDSRRMNLKQPSTAHEWAHSNWFYLIGLAYRLATAAHRRVKGF